MPLYIGSLSAEGAKGIAALQAQTANVNAANTGRFALGAGGALSRAWTVTATDPFRARAAGRSMR